jgi:hypothetical protein
LAFFIFFYLEPLHSWLLLSCLRSSCRPGLSGGTDTTSGYLISTPCWPSQTKVGDPAATAVLSDQSRAAYTRPRRTRSLLGTCPSWRCPLSAFLFLFRTLSPLRPACLSVHPCSILWPLSLFCSHSKNRRIADLDPARRSGALSEF